jgi:hypothetical protein
MSKGIIGTHFDAFDLAMPNGLNPTDSGTTGLAFDYVIPYDRYNDDGKGIKGVVDFLKTLKWDDPENQYKEDVWDCEDRSLWGVAHARCKFPGCPIGVAIGKAVEGDDAGEDHAVIIFWYPRGEGWDCLYFEPDRPSREVTFDPALIIPFPAYTPQSDSRRIELKPCDDSAKFPFIEIGALPLDRAHDFGDISRIETYLKNSVAKCPEPEGRSAKRAFRNKRYLEDRVIWAFIHARREFKNEPVGVTFGTRGGKDHSAIVLWLDSDTYKFFDINDGDITNEFSPRLVFV